MTATEELAPARSIAPEEDIWPPESASPLWVRLAGRVSPSGAVTLAVVGLSALLVFWQLQPSQIFLNTTPAGGDMGAHVWLPDFVKRALLPHLQVTGWTPDNYSGFPALNFYFPLPIVAIALLSYIPGFHYDIVFKVVASIGLVTLPISVWAFTRLARMRFPMPAVMAAATLPFIFSREFTIYGGNIASTMAGEFCFSISLSFAFVFLGLFANGLETGRHRASAAVILACCGLSHVLPLLFAVVGAIVILAMKLATTLDWRRLRFAVPAGVTGGLLISFWALPFVWRLPYATNMHYGKLHHYWDYLSHKDGPLIVAAIVAFILSCVRFNFVGVWLGLMAGVSVLGFVFMPAARLWNARVLPFWFLCLYLLVGVLIYEVGTIVYELAFPPGGQAETNPWMMAVPVLGFIWLAAFVLYPIQKPHSSKDWLGFTPKSASFVPDWVYWNFSGYQNPAKSRSAEYFALVAEMRRLGQDPAFGCGQALWEYEPSLNSMGTPDALMLLPYWTHGCIASEEGLYYESSATTPYHFLNVAETSDHPPDPVGGISYPGGIDMKSAIAHMQMLGDRYFMANSPDVVQQALAYPDQLRLVSTVGPFSYDASADASGTGTVTRSWYIFEVQGSQLVEGLPNQPVVMTGMQTRNSQVWLDAAHNWYLDPTRWNVYEAASGPPSWARVSPDDTHPPAVPEPSVEVTNIHQTTQSISFDVDQTGVPVLVKQSYFPNWQVKGASGVYRVTPNLMVVIPTSTHVVLTYGHTPVDWAGLALTILGLGAVGYLWKAAPVAYPPARRRRRLAFRLVRLDDSGGDGDNGSGHWPPPGSWAPPPAGQGGGTGAGGKVPGLMAPPERTTLDRIFKAYDIRGVVPEELNPELARAIGASFARFAGGERILVAHDMRPSGPELVAAFAAGATESGVDVVDLGLCSTDELYFASGWLNAPGAMFTASHNPARYNGIKLCRAGARPIGADSGLDQIKAGIMAGAGWKGLGVGDADRRTGTVTRRDILHEYAEKVRSFVDLGRLRPLKVVADTANGMGGLVLPAVFEGLPFEYEILFAELDGTFPNHPADPIQPDNLRWLQARIRETGADVGLAFDGDADRCFLVDDQGVPLSGSTTTALVAAAMLDKHPGATILHNLICSKAVPEIIRERGGTPVRTRVGHSYIKAVMADTDALFGGEHSGHYYFRDNFRADSGAIAALVVLEGLSTSSRPLSEIRRDFERYAGSGEINTEVDDPAGVIEAVARHYDGAGARIDRLDGLTVDFGDWWFNLRPSNTEPLLRLNLEAPDRASCDAHVAEVLSLVAARSERTPG